MKRLVLICATVGLILGSASPPAEDRSGAIAVRQAVKVASFAPPPAPVPSPPPAASPVEPSARAAPEPRPAVRAASRRAGAVRVLVSIPQQRLWVFRGDELVATSRVSTGKRGHATPTGTFPITQKRVEHYSNIYDNAPMPYMQRLTDYGIALHGGRVPGYPASHGCIRLPHRFARQLYAMTAHGTPVTITRARPSSTRDALRLVS